MAPSKPNLIAYISKTNYQKIFLKMERMREAKKNEFLQKYLLTDMSVKFLANSFGVMWERKHYRGMKTIMQQGKKVDMIHLLIKGKVKLRVVWKEILTGKSRLTLEKNVNRIRRDVLVEVGVGEMIGDECLFNSKMKDKKSKVSKLDKLYKRMAEVEDLPCYPHHLLSYEVVTESPCDFYICSMEKFKSSCIIDDRILKFMVERVKAKKKNLEFLKRDIKLRMIQSRMLIKELQNDHDIRGFDHEPRSLDEFMKMYKAVAAKSDNDRVIIKQEIDKKVGVLTLSDLKNVGLVEKKDKFQDINVHQLLDDDKKAKKRVSKFFNVASIVSGKKKGKFDWKKLSKGVLERMLEKKLESRKLLREKQKAQNDEASNKEQEGNTKITVKPVSKMTKSLERRIRIKARSKKVNRSRIKADDVKKSKSMQNDTSISSIQTCRSFKKKISRFKKEHYCKILKYTEVEKGNFFDQYVIFGNSKEEIRMGLTDGGLDLVRRRQRRSSTMKNFRSNLYSKKKAEEEAEAKKKRDISKLDNFYNQKQKLAKMISPYNTLDGTRETGWNNTAIKIMNRSTTEKMLRRQQSRSREASRAHSYKNSHYRKRYKDSFEEKISSAVKGQVPKMPYLIRNKDKMSSTMQIASSRGVMTSGIGLSNRIEFVPMVNGKRVERGEVVGGTERDFDGQSNTFYGKLRRIKERKRSRTLYLEKFDKGEGLVEDERKLKWIEKKKKMKFTMMANDITIG